MLGLVGLVLGAGGGWIARGDAPHRARTTDAWDAEPSRGDPAIFGTDRAGEPEPGDGGAGAPARSTGGAGARPDDRRAVPASLARSCDERARAAQERAARLVREIEAARADRVEHEGEPIPMPEALPPRFEGASVRAALERAIAEARVEGRLEELDCSEYPCIAFGRLRGDEEDAERIERSRALSPYRDDVLTLLFWAVTDDAAPHDRPRETGLFALAFFERAERERLGDRLDLRLRARAVDLWATMRPGWGER